jgi:hypothetical protein
MSLRGGKHDWTYKHNMIHAPDYWRLEIKNTRGKVLRGTALSTTLHGLHAVEPFMTSAPNLEEIIGTTRTAESISKRSVTSILLKLVLAN